MKTLIVLSLAGMFLCLMQACDSEAAEIQTAKASMISSHTLILNPLSLEFGLKTLDQSRDIGAVCFSGMDRGNPH